MSYIFFSAQIALSVSWECVEQGCMWCEQAPTPSILCTAASYHSRKSTVSIRKKKQDKHHDSYSRKRVRANMYTAHIKDINA